jgi:hypothetical protein
MNHHGSSEEAPEVNQGIKIRRAAQPECGSAEVGPDEKSSAAKTEAAINAAKSAREAAEDAAKASSFAREQAETDWKQAQAADRAMAYAKVALALAIGAAIVSVAIVIAFIGSLLLS